MYWFWAAPAHIPAVPRFTGLFLPTPSFITPQLCRHFPPLWLAGNIFLFPAAVGSSSLTLYIWTNEQFSSISISSLPRQHAQTGLHHSHSPAHPGAERRKVICSVQHDGRVIICLRSYKTCSLFLTLTVTPSVTPRK